MKTGKPVELSWAEQIDALCQRFGALPSAVLQEDASVLRMIALLDPDCGKAAD